MPETYPRPSQVTVAGWSMIAGSVLLLPAIFDAVATLRSVDTREAMQKSLDSGAARSLGLDIEQLTSIAHQALVVAGAAAAATAILGWFVLRGDRTARVVATVAAVPVLFGGMFAGGLLGAVVAAGAGMLWSGPARDWFAGREPRQPRLPQRAAAPLPEEPRPPADPGVRITEPVTQAPPSHGYGQVPPVPGWAPPGSSYPPPQPMYAAPARPAPVQTACILTWVFTGITAGLGLIMLLALVADPDQIVTAMLDVARDRGQALEVAMVEPILWTFGALLVLWSVSAAVVAMFVWRGQNWARIALIVSAVLAGLAGVFAFPVSILHLAATSWVVGMMVSPMTRAWFRGRS